MQLGSNAVFQWRMTVNAEVFAIYKSEDNSFRAAWESGPNTGYGFHVRASNGQEITREQMEENIRDFLAQIDPVTGYIE